MKAQEKSLADLKVSGLFEFMGVNHPIYSDEENEFFYIKALTDQIDIQWHRQRSKLKEGDNVVLFSTTVFKNETPRCSEIGDYEEGNGTLGAKNCADLDVLKAKEGVYIRLERVHLFLARLSTAQIRRQGNENAADYILSLQLEWADALHKYETQGVAVKTSKVKASMDQAAALDKWLKMKKNTNDDSVVEYIDKQIQELIAAS